MVKWWKNSAGVATAPRKHPDGHMTMRIRGEKYDFPGLPRGHLLYGSLSPLKHEIKNRIFNASWDKLESGVDRKQAIADIKGEILDFICNLGEKVRYDMVPERNLVPAVKEIYRAWTEVEKLHPTRKMEWLKEIMCFILQEDDAYRFRVQWAVRFLNKKDPLKTLEHALSLMEHAEIVDDMKGRIRLLKRVVMLVLEDDEIRRLFEAMVRECDWKKVKLSKADAYFFRAKYFKVDYPMYEY